MRRFRYLLLCLGFLGLCGRSETLESVLSEPYWVGGTSPVLGFQTYGGTWTLENGEVNGPAGPGYRLTYTGYTGENESHGT